MVLFAVLLQSLALILNSGERDHPTSGGNLECPECGGIDHPVAVA